MINIYIMAGLITMENHLPMSEPACTGFSTFEDLVHKVQNSITSVLHSTHSGTELSVWPWYVTDLLSLCSVQLMTVT